MSWHFFSSRRCVAVNKPALDISTGLTPCYYIVCVIAPHDLEHLAYPAWDANACEADANYSCEKILYVTLINSSNSGKNQWKPRIMWLCSCLTCKYEDSYTDIRNLNVCRSIVALIYKQRFGINLMKRRKSTGKVNLGNIWKTSLW